MNATDNTLIGHMPLKPLIVTVLRLTALFNTGSATNNAKASSARVVNVVCTGSEELASIDDLLDVGIMEKKRAIGMEMTRPSE